MTLIKTKGVRVIGRQTQRYDGLGERGRNGHRPAAGAQPASHLGRRARAFCALHTDRRWVRCTSICRRLTSCCLPSRGGALPHRQREVPALLQSLRLPTMAEVCAELARKAAKEGLAHEALLSELARRAGERRRKPRIERLLSQPGLPREKTVAPFQLERLPMPIRVQVERLRSGEVVQDATKVVAVGPPGVGKSPVLAAVAHDLVRQGHTVVWTSTAQLLHRFWAAKGALRLPQELVKLHRSACLM